MRRLSQPLPILLPLLGKSRSSMSSQDESNTSSAHQRPTGTSTFRWDMPKPFHTFSFPAVQHGHLESRGDDAAGFSLHFECSFDQTQACQAAEALTGDTRCNSGLPSKQTPQSLERHCMFLHTTTHRHAYHHAVGSVASRKDMDDDPSFYFFASVLSSSSTSLLLQHTGQTVSASDQ
jgi:hypothetical protein